MAVQLAGRSGRVKPQMTIQEMEARDLAIKQQRLSIMNQKLGLANNIAGLGRTVYGVVDTLAPLLASKGDQSQSKAGEVSRAVAGTGTINDRLEERAPTQDEALAAAGFGAPASKQSAPPSQPEAWALQQGHNEVRDAWGRMADRYAAGGPNAPLPTAMAKGYPIDRPGEPLQFPDPNAAQNAPPDHQFAAAPFARVGAEASPNKPEGPALQEQQPAQAPAKLPETDIAGLAAVVDRNKFNTFAETKNALAMAAARGDRAAVAEILQRSKESRLEDVAPQNLADVITGAHIDRARQKLAEYGKIDPMFEANRAAVNARASASAAAGRASDALATTRDQERGPKIEKLQYDAYVAGVNAEWADVKAKEEQLLRRNTLANGRASRGHMAAQDRIARQREARQNEAHQESLFDKFLEGLSGQNLELRGMSREEAFGLFKKYGPLSLSNKAEPRALPSDQTGPAAATPPISRPEIARKAAADVREKAQAASRLNALIGAGARGYLQQRGFQQQDKLAAERAARAGPGGSKKDIAADVRKKAAAVESKLGAITVGGEDALVAIIAQYPREQQQAAADELTQYINERSELNVSVGSIKRGRNGKWAWFPTPVQPAEE